MLPVPNPLQISSFFCSLDPSATESKNNCMQQPHLLQLEEDPADSRLHSDGIGLPVCTKFNVGKACPPPSSFELDDNPRFSTTFSFQNLLMCRVPESHRIVTMVWPGPEQPNPFTQAHVMMRNFPEPWTRTHSLHDIVESIPLGMAQLIYRLIVQHKVPDWVLL